MEDVIDTGESPEAGRARPRTRTFVIAGLLIVLAGGGFFVINRLSQEKPDPTPSQAVPTRPVTTPPVRPALPADLRSQAMAALPTGSSSISGGAVEVIAKELGGEGGQTTADGGLPKAGRYHVDLLCLGEGEILVRVYDPEKGNPITAPVTRLTCAPRSAPPGPTGLDVEISGTLLLIDYAPDAATAAALAWRTSAAPPA